MSTYATILVLSRTGLFQGDALLRFIALRSYVCSRMAQGLKSQSQEESWEYFVSNLLKSLTSSVFQGSPINAVSGEGLGACVGLTAGD